MSTGPESGERDPRREPLGAELTELGVPLESQPEVVLSVAARSVFHQGPLPSVEQFEGYERVCPGAARDILNMAKAQQTHAHEMESSALRSEIQYRANALFVAGAMAAGWIGGVVACAAIGQAAVALALAGALGVTTMLVGFVRGRALFEKHPAATEVDKERTEA